MRIYLPTNFREEAQFNDEDVAMFYSNHSGKSFPTKYHIINEYNRLAALIPNKTPEWFYYIP
jgi:hypothetical protein